MVDRVREKPPGPCGRPSLQARSGGIGTFQPEGELPLQTRCRCNGLSSGGQSKGVVAWIAVVMQPFPTEPVSGLKAHGTRGRGGRTI
jgi:hypothetical protein